MSKFKIIASALSLALPLIGSPPAGAADLALKAAPIASSTAGVYLCAQSSAAVARSNVSGSGGLFATDLVSGNLNAAGAGIGGCAGYMWGDANLWFSLHGSAEWQNVSASAPINGANANIASRWAATQEIRVGGKDPLSFIQAAVSALGVQGLSLPAFPTPSIGGGLNLSAAPRTYLAVGVREFGIKGSFGALDGADVGIAPMLRAGAIWQVLNASGRPTGGGIDLSAGVAWPSKGVTLTNVFGSSGPVGLHGSAGFGTTYFTTLAYVFAIPR